ncbi:hypothetical protein AAKU67_001550 [Oxalobacteraceae bacterium GrIS 2.11]
MRAIQIQSSTIKLRTWISLWALVGLLGQAMLPTLAYLRSDSTPGLWAEICSVYGVRQNTTSDDKVPMQHADCPLCLHIFSDVILAAADFSQPLQLLFFKEISSAAIQQQFFGRRTVTAEARAPPEFH